jgi:hypothetical protein
MHRARDEQCRHACRAYKMIYPFNTPKQKEDKHLIGGGNIEERKRK